MKKIAAFWRNRPWSYRAQFERDIDSHLDRSMDAGVVTKRRLATVRAQFHTAAQTIAATLTFGDDGLLTNFASDDRSRASADGQSFTTRRFSTPVRWYKPVAHFAPGSPSTDANSHLRVAAYADARWGQPEEDFTYAQFEVLSVEYNVQAGGEPMAAPAVSSPAAV